MATSGGQPGNQNAVKAKRFEGALRRALARAGDDAGKGLAKVADALVKAGMAGESWAVREIADRLDGKPKQQNEITGAGGGPVFGRLEMVIIDPAKPSP